MFVWFYSSRGKERSKFDLVVLFETGSILLRGWAGVGDGPRVRVFGLGEIRWVGCGCVLDLFVGL